MLWTTGNILGEVIDTIVSGKSIQTLVSIPKGSAETDLMRVAPIFYVYHYLQTKNEWSLLGPNTFMIQIEMQKKLKDGKCAQHCAVCFIVFHIHTLFISSFQEFPAFLPSATVTIPTAYGETATLAPGTG